MHLFEVSTDSTCDLKKDYVEKRGIWFTPLTFTMEKEGVIEEGFDNFSKEEEYIEFYEKVSSGYFPRTAKLNYESHIAHFTKMARAGVRSTIHFMISSGLANTIEITRKAAEDVQKEYPDFKVYPLDPLSATVGQGALVTIAADCRDKGMTAEETYEYLMKERFYLQHCIIPNDLFYLKKGGRVSGATALVGTMLNVKPMLAFDMEGKLTTFDKRKGMKKAFVRVLECIDAAPIRADMPMSVVHTNNEKGAIELADLIEKHTGIRPPVSIMGPVIGSHVGPGSVSFGWFADKTREELLNELN